MARSLIFLLLTFGGSWALAFTFFGVFGARYTWQFALMGAFYMFTPGVAACIVQKAYGEKIAEPLRIGFRVNRWFFVAWLIPPLLAVASVGVSLMMPGIELTADPFQSNFATFLEQNLSDAKQAEMRRVASEMLVHPVLWVLAGGMVSGVTINAVAGFGEELGWRGFLQREWSCHGFWKSSWLIGLILGMWHLPFLLQGHNYPGHPYSDVVVMSVWTMLFSPLIAFISNRAESVVAAAVMHGSLNGTAIAPTLLLRGGDSLRVGVMGVAGILVLVVLNVGLYWMVRWKPIMARNR